jgi:hypothetical protein
MKFLLLLLATATFWPLGVRAHDLTYELHGSGEATVVFRYGDGSPMAGAPFHVFGPGDTALPEASGLTDDAGRAPFRADRDGDWRIDAGDAAGHATRARITVAEGMPAIKGGSVPVWLAALSLFLNVMLGLFLALRRVPGARRTAGRAPTPVPQGGSIAK